MLIPEKIRALTLDLDDTLWPVWPVIERAERALFNWLQTHAPRTAALTQDAKALRAIRDQVARERPEWLTNLSEIRRESIRRALQQSGDNPALAEPAFSVFFEERQQVSFYPDALPALAALARVYPLVALSNGNADLQRVGIGQYFVGSVSAQGFGIGKPDARIFAEAMRLTGLANLQADEVLHIGDDAELDVLGAHAVGKQTAWVNRRAEQWLAPIAPSVCVTQLDELCGLLGVKL